MQSSFGQRDATAGKQNARTRLVDDDLRPLLLLFGRHDKGALVGVSMMAVRGVASVSRRARSNGGWKSRVKSEDRFSAREWPATSPRCCCRCMLVDLCLLCAAHQTSSNEVHGMREEGAN